MARYFGLALIVWGVAVDMLAHPAILTAGVGLTLVKTLFGQTDE